MVGIAISTAKKILIHHIIQNICIPNQWMRTAMRIYICMSIWFGMDPFFFIFVFAILGFPIFSFACVLSSNWILFFSDYNISCEYIWKKGRKFWYSFSYYYLISFRILSTAFLSLFYLFTYANRKRTKNLQITSIHCPCHSDQPQRNTQFSTNTLFLKATLSSPHKYTLVDADGDGEWKCLLSFLLDYIFVKLSVQDICINVIKKILSVEAKTGCIYIWIVQVRVKRYHLT